MKRMVSPEQPRTLLAFLWGLGTVLLGQSVSCRGQQILLVSYLSLEKQVIDSHESNTLYSIRRSVSQFMTCGISSGQEPSQ